MRLICRRTLRDDKQGKRMLSKINSLCVNVLILMEERGRRKKKKRNIQEILQVINCNPRYKCIRI